MQGKNYTLAVFDSDRAMLNACALILKEQDIDIHAFANSGDFVDQLQRSAPSAILLDNSILPHGGLEVLRLLKQHNELNKIPVIYMTANGAIGDKVLKEGAEYLLIKPFDLLQLTATVLKACGAGH
ncbi:response regulator transcription factor [Niabella sp. CJ426]|uniref:response regulator transcription factor n=1 Tax=Niabella sp. CJ426 TaxID=3393740 RepID=UPI003D068C46